jgi:hypothetical protein
MISTGIGKINQAKELEINFFNLEFSVNNLKKINTGSHIGIETITLTKGGIRYAHRRAPSY